MNTKNIRPLRNPNGLFGEWSEVTSVERLRRRVYELELENERLLEAISKHIENLILDTTKK